MDIFDKNRQEEYELLSRIGKGGYGEVYKAKRCKDGKLFAIKRVKKKFDDKYERFIHEKEVHPKLKDSSIVTFYTAFSDKEYEYIVLQLCAKGDLVNYIKKQPGGFLSEDKAFPIIRGIVQGISYLHANNVMHRDLKLANILLDDNYQPKICDFGLATQIIRDGDNLTVCGTPNYMSPEILAGYYGKECDIWALGAIIHNILTGDLLFDGNSKREIFGKVKNYYYDPIKLQEKRVSKEAIDLVQRCLEKRIERRIKASDLLKHDFFKRRFDSGHYTMSTNASSTAFTSKQSTSHPPRNRVQDSMSDLQSDWKNHAPQIKANINNDLISSRSALSNKRLGISSVPTQRHKDAEHFLQQEDLVKKKLSSNGSAYEKSTNRNHPFRGPSPCDPELIRQNKQRVYCSSPENINYPCKSQKPLSDIEVYQRQRVPTHEHRQYVSNDDLYGQIYSHDDNLAHRSSRKIIDSWKKPYNEELQHHPHYQSSRHLSHERPPSRHLSHERPPSRHLSHERPPSRHASEDRPSSRHASEDRSSHEHLSRPLSRNPSSRLPSSSSPQISKELSHGFSSNSKIKGRPSTSKSRSTAVLKGPFSTLRIEPMEVKKMDWEFYIKDDGTVWNYYLTLVKDITIVKEAIIISRDGLQISIYEPQAPENTPRDVDFLLLQNKLANKIYSRQDLPTKYYTKYNKVFDIVQKISVKTPKVTYFSPLAKCILMESLTDYNALFYTGEKLVLGKDQHSITYFDGRVQVIYDGENLSPTLAEKYQHAIEMRRRCLAIHDYNVTQESLTQDSFFPTVTGKKRSVKIFHKKKQISRSTIDKENVSPLQSIPSSNDPRSKLQSSSNSASSKEKGDHRKPLSNRQENYSRLSRNENIHKDDPYFERGMSGRYREPAKENKDARHCSDPKRLVELDTVMTRNLNIIRPFLKEIDT